MPTLPDAFHPLPDAARLWLLALAEAPPESALAGLEAGLQAVVSAWRHKGHAYQGAAALLEGQVLAVAEPDLATNPSGCAIDGMLRRLERLVAEAGLRLLDPDTQVLVRSGGRLRAVPKAALEALLAEGALGPDTPVLDLSLYSLGDLRQGRLERPLAQTWIGRKFQVA